jgi:hypothetical protein
VEPANPPRNTLPLFNTPADADTAEVTVWADAVFLATEATAASTETPRLLPTAL